MCFLLSLLSLLLKAVFSLDSRLRGNDGGGECLFAFVYSLHLSFGRWNDEKNTFICWILACLVNIGQKLFARCWNDGI
jgi:hypothetical protein